MGIVNWVWWHMPRIPALERLRQGNCCKFEASLSYTATPSKTYKMEHRPEKGETGRGASAYVYGGDIVA